MTAGQYSLAYSQRAATGLVTVILMFGVGVWMFARGLGSEQAIWYRMFFWAE